MRAIIVEQTGGPETLKLVELPTPEPKAGEVRVEVEAAGVNFIDIYHRSGLYKLPLPARLGLEGAGIVRAIGEGVDARLLGRRVAWAGVSGSYASEVIAPLDKVVEVPESVDGPTAAAAMLQGMTAHYLARSTFVLGAGHHALVHSAAGGVGRLLCQLGSAAKATMIGVVSSEAKVAVAKAAGATEVIVSQRDDFVAETRRLTAGVGVDVVYDAVGRDTFERGLDCLRPRGLMVSYGQSSGMIPPIDLQLLSQKGSLFVTRPTMQSYLLTRAELVLRATEVLALIAQQKLQIAIYQRFPLAEVALAHQALTSRGTTGKLILIP